MSVDDQEQLVCAAAIAALVGVPIGTIHQLVHQRRIPHVRFGRRFVRFRPAEIMAWIEQHRVVTAVAR